MRYIDFCQMIFLHCADFFLTGNSPSKKLKPVTSKETQIDDRDMPDMIEEAAARNEFILGGVDLVDMAQVNDFYSDGDKGNELERLVRLFGSLGTKPHISEVWAHIFGSSSKKYTKRDMLNDLGRAVLHMRRNKQ